jgi:predicted RNA binding protein YcfA (HicA-like mRNA interferase family)
MGKNEKLLATILGGRSDQNIPFSDICRILKALGFEERVKGSHHIFSKINIPEIINIQDKEGKAKPYQVKQIRIIILKHKLDFE